MRTGAPAPDELSLLLAFAWIVGWPVPNQQRPDSPRHQNNSHSRRSHFVKYVQRPRRCSPHSVGLRTGSIWVLMISVLAPAVAAADAEVAEPNHPHTEGRYPANVEWLEPAKRRTPL